MHCIVFCRSQSEDSDVDWEPQSETVRCPTPSPAEGGCQKHQRSSSASTSTCTSSVRRGQWCEKSFVRPLLRSLWTKDPHQHPSHTPHVSLHPQTQQHPTSCIISQRVAKMWLSRMQTVSADGSAHSATKRHQLAVQRVMFPCVLLLQGTVSMSGTHKMGCKMPKMSTACSYFVDIGRVVHTVIVYWKIIKSLFEIQFSIVCHFCIMVAIL